MRIIDDQTYNHTFAAVKKPRRRRSPGGANQARLSRATNKVERFWLATALHSRFAIIAIACLHLLGLFLIFSPIAGLFSNAPLLDQDWGLHFHHVKSLEAFWQQDKTLWGYNPFFMAGYPSNTIQDLSVKFFALTAVACSSFGIEVMFAFKLLAFFAMASVPWWLYLAGNLLFAEDSERNPTAVIVALLGTLYWWNSLPREMFFYGMLGFPAAAYLALVGIGALSRLARRPWPWCQPHAATMVIAVVLPMLHVQALVIILPAVTVLSVAETRERRSGFVLWLGLAGIIAVVVNSPWLLPAFNHRGDDASRIIVEQLPLFTSTDWSAVFKDYLTTTQFWSFRSSFWEKGLRLALLVLGGLGIKLLWQRDQRLSRLLLASAIALFIIAYLGSLIPPLRAWQPLRFKLPLDLILVIPTAYVVAQWLTGSATTVRSSWPVILASLGICAACVNIVQTESRGKMLLRSTLSPEINEIVSWIRSHTTGDGRILFEESGDETGFVYDGSYLSSYIPHWTGRQLIGGPINLYNDRHHFAEFHSAQLFQRPISQLSDTEITDYFARYNIGAVITFHPESQRRLLAVPGLLRLDRQIGPVALLKSQHALTWFLEGSGDAAANFNRLQLRNLKGHSVTLKYHWVEGLTSSPPVRIQGKIIGDDPIPFIQLVDPPPEVTLAVK